MSPSVDPAGDSWQASTALSMIHASSPVRSYFVNMPGTLTAALHREEDWYIAQCLEVDVASQGHTLDEALANLAEAVELYLEEEEDDPARHHR
jgi:predicted RNase H-like HicB family nuclease